MNPSSGKASPVLWLCLILSMSANVALLVLPRWQQLEDRLLLRFQAPPALRATDHVWSTPGSLGTVIMYSDYECPYCARTFAVIKKVKADKNFAFVLRHFPLALHPNAQLAAEASECAAEQGRFWDYSSALFENGNSLSDAAFEAIAATVGLDMVNFSACLKDHKYAAVVDADRDDGDHMRIRGTPVTYINGRRVEGAFSESLLKSKLARGGP
jgi:protein-disulfide isomerase